MPTRDQLRKYCKQLNLNFHTRRDLGPRLPDADGIDCVAVDPASTAPLRVVAFIDTKGRFYADAGALGRSDGTCRWKRRFNRVSDVDLDRAIENKRPVHW